MEGFTLLEIVFQAACRKTEKKIRTNAIQVIFAFLFLFFQFLSVKIYKMVVLYR